MDMHRTRLLFLLLLFRAENFASERLTSKITCLPLTTCKSLHLECKDSKIRLEQAVYKGLVFPSSQKPFNETEMAAVYSSCSYKDVCDYQVRAWHGYTKAEIQYFCVDLDTVLQLSSNISINMTGEINLVHDTTGNSGGALVDRNTECDVTSGTSELHVTLEDFRGCHVTEVQYGRNGSSVKCCRDGGIFRMELSVSHEEMDSGRLLHSFSIVTDSDVSTPGLFWLRLRSDDDSTMEIVCKPDIRTTVSSTQTTPVSNTYTDSTAITAWTAQPPQTGNLSAGTLPVSAIAAGVAATGAVLVGAAAVTWCILQRRRRKVQENNKASEDVTVQNEAYDINTLPRTEGSREPETDPQYSSEEPGCYIYAQPMKSSMASTPQRNGAEVEEVYDRIDLKTNKMISQTQSRTVTLAERSDVTSLNSEQEDTYHHITSSPDFRNQSPVDDYSHIGDVVRH